MAAAATLHTQRSSTALRSRLRETEKLSSMLIQPPGLLCRAKYRSRIVSYSEAEQPNKESRKGLRRGAKPGVCHAEPQRAFMLKGGSPPRFQLARCRARIPSPLCLSAAADGADFGLSCELYGV